MKGSLRRFLIVDQGLVPGLCTGLINGAIAWWLNLGSPELAFRGEPGLVGDFLITAFVLPQITCLIVSPLVIRQVRKGQVGALEPARSMAARLYSRSSWLRGMLVGLLGMVIALPFLLLWSWQGPMVVTLNEYVGTKVGFTGVLGALVTPLIAWWALVYASLPGSTLKSIQHGSS